MRLHQTGRPSMSKTDYRWYDLKSDYVYEVRYSASPYRHQVVKRSLALNYVVKVLASGLTREAAEGYIKLLKEE